MDVKIFAKTIEPEAKAQVEKMAASSVGEGAKIRIMPDCHAGKGCTIGTTMTISDKVCPNLVGVDIGCGVMLVKTDIRFEDRLKELDNVIRKYIPFGKNVHTTKTGSNTFFEQMWCWGELNSDTQEWALRSLGTLGGGNHFIEAYADGYLCVHTGSRNIGLSVAKHYQDKAAKAAREIEKPDLSKIEPQKREAALLAWKEKIKKSGPDELAYLTGSDKDHYLCDSYYMNDFAYKNRRNIVLKIVTALGGKILSRIDTKHNYIDLRTGVLRKGAVAANLWEPLVIPMNMRDGLLVCVGKGNEDWNCSAPHGAGRLYSRSQAKQRFTVEEYKTSMQGIYSTCIGEGTLDEAPFAYKDAKEIMDCIEPTVYVLDRLKPIYNFKSEN